MEFANTNMGTNHILSVVGCGNSFLALSIIDPFRHCTIASANFVPFLLLDS